MDQKLDTLYTRYEYLQRLYYDMYIDSYISPICPKPDPKWETLSPVRWWYHTICSSNAHNALIPAASGLKQVLNLNNDQCKLYFKLYIEFKSVCKLLSRIKMLLQDKPCKSVHLLGSEEINVLLNYKDIKTFFDNNKEIYPFIDSNYV
jgi:hypothetical protein